MRRWIKRWQIKRPPITSDTLLIGVQLYNITLHYITLQSLQYNASELRGEVERCDITAALPDDRYHRYHMPLPQPSDFVHALALSMHNSYFQLRK